MAATDYMRSYPDRLWMWNDLEGRWRWIAAGTSAILENSVCTLDASQSTIAGNGEILTINFNLTPKEAIIEAPFGTAKRIWLRLKDTAGNQLRDLQIGSWTVSP